MNVEWRVQRRVQMVQTWHEDHQGKWSLRQGFLQTVALHLLLPDELSWLVLASALLLVLRGIRFDTFGLVSEKWQKEKTRIKLLEALQTLIFQFHCRDVPPQLPPGSSACERGLGWDCGDLLFFLCSRGQCSFRLYHCRRVRGFHSHFKAPRPPKLLYSTPFYNFPLAPHPHFRSEISSTAAFCDNPPASRLHFHTSYRVFLLYTPP